MSDQERVFAPLGVMSAREACRRVISRIPAKDGITHDQAVYEVSELCEHPHTLNTVVNAMRDASESLLANGDLGVVARPGFGWVRMNDPAAVRHAQRHLDKSRRAVVRAGTAASAADPERLSWEERQARDRISSTARRVQEIEGRRSQRLRPVPAVIENTEAS